MKAFNGGKIMWKKIVVLMIVLVSIPAVWFLKRQTTINEGNTLEGTTAVAQDSMFELVATGDFKLEDVVGKGYPVIINFSATWCGPCQKMKPIYAEANVDYQGKAILKTIDVDDPSMQEIVRAAGVSAIPHQIFFYPDGTTPTKEKSPKLFEYYGVVEMFNRREFSTKVSRTGAMDRKTLDGIIAELNAYPMSEEK